MREIKGDLFDSSDCLAHCVSRDFNMSAGIAKEFSYRYGRVAELIRQNPQIGGVASLDVDDGYKYVFYLVTKEKYWQKPTMEAFTRCLESLRDDCISKDMNRLSIPHIGCGLDGLNWDVVKKEIVNVFSDTPIRITVYTPIQKNPNFSKSAMTKRILHSF